jgi:hypothetical protein
VITGPDMPLAQQAALRGLEAACEPDGHEARRRWDAHKEAAYAERLCPLCACPLGGCQHRWHRMPDGHLIATMGMQIPGPGEPQ